jgi:Holliday junction resolvase-like predicted endonuclease
VHPRVQGDLGEASAIEWLTLNQAVVCKPLFHSPEFDLVAEMGGRLVRIEVKTTWRRTPLDHWQAMLCTRGGNQSWSGTTKNFDSKRCEFVFVHVGDGRRWFIPSTRIDGVTAIVLGGGKYSQFEIDRGFPLPPRTVNRLPSTIASR